MISGLSKQCGIVLILAFGYICFLGFHQLRDDGQVGATRKNGFGCTCHGLPESPDVKVWIEGPARIQKGTTHTYSVMMTGGPAVVGGFNVAAQRGALSPGDTTSHLLPSSDGLELSHSAAKQFINDTVRWMFMYQAPADTTEDTLFSVGNSADGNGVPPGDAFNFGENFIVDLFEDSSLSVSDERVPGMFELFQNYPNPFNPETKISFTLQVSGYTSLKIYDVSGREVAILFQEMKPPGSYTVTWSGSGYSSGIYLYRLTTEKFSETRKMLLLK
jgi:hypothetical protein